MVSHFRLSVKRRTGLDLIKGRIEKPYGTLPDPALPAWHNFSLDDKIPMVRAPKDCLVFSRGKVGDKVSSEMNNNVVQK